MVFFSVVEKSMSEIHSAWHNRVVQFMLVVLTIVLLSHVIDLKQKSIFQGFSPVS